MVEVFSDLTTSIDSRPMFNGGLRQRAIDKIIIHHNATTNPNVALNTWVVGLGVGTSAHYEITDTDIIGAVGENYVAYHAGGTGGNDVPKISDPNGRSIGLEHVNSSGTPNWEVSDETLKNSARLIADICNRYGLPINRETIMLHREVTSTACPGGLDIDKLIEYAKGNTPDPINPNTKGDKDMLLFKSDIKNAFGGSADDVFLQTGNVVIKLDSGDSLKELRQNGVPFATITKRNAEGIIRANGGLK